MSTQVRPRRTVQAGAVLAALVEAGGFCSAQDIYMRLRAGGRSIGLSTVYRHLQSLAEQGEADVIRTSDGEATYRYCQTRGVHHHHLVCRRCGRAEEIEDRPVERWASAVAEKFGYTAIDHIVEVFGTCGDCSA